jgi:Malonyl-CoA decarboxylase C-terminal domain
MKAVCLKYRNHGDLQPDFCVQHTFVELILSEQYTPTNKDEKESEGESSSSSSSGTMAVLKESEELLLWLCVEYLYRTKNHRGYPYGTCSTVQYSTVHYNIMAMHCYCVSCTCSSFHEHFTPYPHLSPYRCYPSLSISFSFSITCVSSPSLSDPVARFHLRNGASFHRLNWTANMSKKGITLPFFPLLPLHIDLK